MDWKGLVGSVAPILGGTLGGPFGAMAGKFIAESLGVEESELSKVIEKANPETMLKIKELDNQFEIEMEKLGLSVEKLHAEDRGGARDMAVKTSLWPQAIISAIFIIGFIVVLQAVFSGSVELTPMQQQMANILIGILSAGIIQIMNFWFGSSSGSKEKTQLMGKN